MRPPALAGVWSWKTAAAVCAHRQDPGHSHLGLPLPLTLRNPLAAPEPRAMPRLIQRACTSCRAASLVQACHQLPSNRLLGPGGGTKWILQLLLGCKPRSMLSTMVSGAPDTRLLGKMMLARIDFKGRVGEPASS